MKLKPASLDDILRGRIDFPYAEHRPLVYYKDYCKIGFYPYFQKSDAPIHVHNETLGRDLGISRNSVPDYIECLLRMHRLPCGLLRNTFDITKFWQALPKLGIAVLLD